jgi:S-adenosylmethionine decarboxylase
MHLILDGTYTEDLLSSPEKVEQWLIDTVHSIGMSVIAGPYVEEVGGDKHRGITGIVVLAESHVAIHTFPEYKYVFVDVFSCFWFSPMPVAIAIYKALGMTKISRMEEMDRKLPDI